MGRAIETEYRVGGVRAVGGAGGGEIGFNGNRGSGWKDDEGLETDGGDGYMTM